MMSLTGRDETVSLDLNINRDEMGRDHCVANIKEAPLRGNPSGNGIFSSEFPGYLNGKHVSPLGIASYAFRAFYHI